MLSQKQYNKLISVEIWIEQEETTMFLSTEEEKEIILDFSQGNVRVL